MTAILRRFIKDDTGATSIEYGLVATLISVAILASATTLGTNMAGTWNTVANNMK